jgi:hypothetical protein
MDLRNSKPARAFSSARCRDRRVSSSMT